MEQYEIRGREVFSAKGKVVATLDGDGNPVMAPGMAGAHKRAVEEFLAQSRGAKEPPPPMPEIEEAEKAPEPEVPELGVDPRPAADAAADAADYMVATIPADRLPPFSKELGVNTPGFAEFVKDNHLSAAQVAALVKRLTSFPREKK